MKSNNNKIKEALGQEVPVWDDSAVWDGIEQSLPSDKPRLRFLYWLLPAVFLLVGTALFLIKSNQSGIQDPDNKTLVKESISEEVKSIDDQSTHVNPLEVKMKKEVISEVEKEIQISHLATEKPEVDVRDATIIKSTTQSIVSSQRQSKVMAQSQPSTSSQFQSGLTQIGSRQTSIASSALTSSSVPVVSSDKTSNAHILIKTDLVTSLRFLAGVQYSEILTQNVTGSPQLPLETSLIKRAAYTQVENQVNLSKNSLLVAGGVFATRRRLTSGDSDWIASKERQERDLEATDINIQYQRRLGKNILLGVGLGYAQVNEELIWRDTIISSTQTTYTGSIKKVSTIYDDLVITTPNAYQTIYLPMTVGYRVERGKWSYTANVGGELAVYHSFRGRYLTANGLINSEEEGESIPINQSFGLQSVTTSLSGAYMIKENIHLVGGLRTKFGVSNRLEDASNELRYNGYGVTLGLRYDLKAINRE